ncbi:MAG TPA: radical SAM protein [Candidatus Omnitrophota bacterium]|nr:radical SAM protein [Candidatus Omnitrophota bacterium]HPS20476.1 radical SAM protein [Candidatus Omnitrophota bacterium]
MEIKEVEASRALNPTSIDLGEYVINPYKGCAYGCLYCYARFSKVAQKDERAWGEYVDVRVNLPELLKKEVAAKRPGRVLLGSTTECFQPAEKKYGITKKILRILNDNGVKFSILTRSPGALDCLDELKSGYCEKLYFTVNTYGGVLKSALEPRSPAFEDRRHAIQTLCENGVNVIPYVSPLLPGLTDIALAFEMFSGSGRIEFEGLNFNLGNIRSLIEAVSERFPERSVLYEKMLSDVEYYGSVWNSVSSEIRKNAVKHKKNHSIYIHERGGYFENKYSSK